MALQVGSVLSMFAYVLYHVRFSFRKYVYSTV